jgi:radical SAM superfamily enzyme YgiQ (UPF0313 family)
MSLASALRLDSDNHAIEIYDMRIEGEDCARLKGKVNQFNPDIAGFSALSVESQSLYASAGAVRETGFDGPIIAGGPHPTSFPEETLACKAIDYAVTGEGEETFRELVSAFVNGKKLNDVRGIAYRENKGIIQSPARPPIENLDALPFPAYDLVDLDEYAKYIGFSPFRTGRYMNLFTSRACPFGCIYCHSIFGRKFRACSPERVLDQAKLLHEKYGIHEFEIVDDIFNCNLERAKRILDLLGREGLRPKISFPNGLRCDRLDRDFLKKTSTFRSPQIAVPVETASPRLQSLIGKRLDLEKVNETIQLCNELGIYTRGFFMLGFPTETAKELNATLDFAYKSKLHAAFFFLVTPYKKTALYELCYEKLKDRDFSLTEHAYHHSTINCSDVPDRVLFRAQKWATVRFALSPSRILRVLRDAPDRRFFWRGIKIRWELAGNRAGGAKKGKIPKIY